MGSILSSAVGKQKLEVMGVKDKFQGLDKTFIPVSKIFG
jgi:hypothetical protein